MIHIQMTSSRTANSIRIRPARLLASLPVAIALSMLSWSLPAQAQSPVELSPPLSPTVSGTGSTTPNLGRPLTLSPPRAGTQTLIPPRANLSQVQPPSPVNTSNVPTVVTPPSSQSNLPFANPSKEINDVTAMAPAIQAVRTQLEILSPPSTTMGSPSLNSPPTEVVAIDAPNANFSNNSTSNAAQPRVLTVPHRSSGSNYGTNNAPSSATSIAPGNASPARQVGEHLPPAPRASTIQFSSRSNPGRPTPALTVSAPDSSPVSSSILIEGPATTYPTRVAQAPQQSALPDNYRPLAPPAQPGPQPGAVFSQAVGPNQIGVIPAPGSPSNTTPYQPQAQFNSQIHQQTIQPQTIQPLAQPNNARGIEVVNVDPNSLGAGAVTEMMGHAEPVWQFNFQNAPWPIVIRNFAKQNGMALQMLSEPTGTFTFVDQRPYPASEALDLLNDYLISEGFLLIRNGNKLTSITAGGPIQEGIVPFVPMRQIEILGRNELASVAIPIRATDAAMVMNEVQSLLSRVGRAQVVSNSSRLVITDTGAYLRRARDIIGGYGLAASDVQTVVVHLKNTTADNMSSTISAHLGISLGASSGVITAGGNGGPGSVQTASFSTNSTMNNSSTRVIPDRETNSLLISGTPAEVAEIQSLICQLDQARAQVILQGLILEVNLGNVNELGAEVGLQDSVLFNRSVIDNLVTLQNTNTAPNGVQTTTQNVMSQTSAPGFNFNGQPLGNNTAVSPNVLGAQGLGNLGVGRTNSQLGFGGLVLSASSNSVSLLLRALQANYEVDVLSRPQIRTVDNKEAFIQIGQQVPVVDGVNVTAVGTANPIIRQDQAGIILKMTPNVSPDGLIQIKVSAEKSAFKLQPGTGVPIFTDARNGTVIQAPIKDITTAQATISARAGQTIVLGGMITRDEETIQRRVPGLSRIPLLGRLFRYDYNNTTRKELLIFLTPHLIADDASSDAYKDAEIARTHAPLERAEEMHGPLYTNPPVVEEEVVAP